MLSTSQGLNPKNQDNGHLPLNIRPVDSVKVSHRPSIWEIAAGGGLETMTYRTPDKSTERSKRFKRLPKRFQDGYELTSGDAINLPESTNLQDIDGTATHLLFVFVI